jgi:copper(I)-binding protein
VPAPRSLLLLLVAALGLAACGGGSEDGAIAATDVRSRMSPQMAGVAAVYLDLDNGTDQDDALIGASVPAEVAGRVELHETYTVDDGTDDGMGDTEGMDDDAMGDTEGMDDDAMGDTDDTDGMDEGAAMMSMREVAQIALPAGETVELVPGGLHVMLFDLVEDLVPGDTFELTLDFEQADSLTVTAEVREDV